MAPPGRLNVFQRLARTWDAVHPYNAGQALRIAGTFATARIDGAWATAAESMGLGRAIVRGGEYGFEEGTVGPVRHLTDEHDLSRHFTAELNRPFHGDEPPFRPFARHEGGTIWLGVVYQHWVGDSVSVRELLGTWLGRLQTGRAIHKRSANLVRWQSRDLLTGWRGDWDLGDTLLGLMRRYGEYRRTRKIHTFGPLEYPVRVRLYPAERGLVPRLLRHARARGAKLNDVLVAALAEACDRLVPAQQRHGRADLALSTVADLRPGLPAAAREGFGCLLGFTTTVCRAPQLRDWDRLLAAVAAQSRAQRATGVGPASVLWMLAAECAARFTPPGRVYDFYRKEVPLAAGASNVNLNGTWVTDSETPTVLDYVRISPTGPIVPIALAATSLRDDLQLTLTYRTALLNDWTAAELVQAVMCRLRRVAELG